MFVETTGRIVLGDDDQCERRGLLTGFQAVVDSTTDEQLAEACSMAVCVARVEETNLDTGVQPAFPLSAARTVSHLPAPKAKQL